MQLAVQIVEVWRLWDGPGNDNLYFEDELSVSPEHHLSVMNRVYGLLAVPISGGGSHLCREPGHSLFDSSFRIIDNTRLSAAKQQGIRALQMMIRGRQTSDMKSLDVCHTMRLLGLKIWRNSQKRLAVKSLSKYLLHHINKSHLQCDISRLLPKYRDQDNVQ